MVVEERTVREGYKMTDLGEIPVEWEVKKLEEISEFNNGKAHENCIDDNGEYIVVNSKFISSDGTVYKRSNSNLSPLIVNDITMVMSDVPNGKALAKCFLVDKSDTYTLNQRICSIKGKDMNSQYLFYFLNRNKYFIKFDDGVGQTNLRKGEILECPILVPPLSEQQKIVEILSIVDEQIENTDQLISKTKELKKGLMQQLLTKGIGHTKFKQTELGEIPVEWDLCKMEDICERIIVGIASSTAEYYTTEENSVPIIRNQNIKENKIDVTDLLFITSEFDVQNKKKRLRKGDLLTVRTGYPGITAVVTSDLEDCQSFTTLISSPYPTIIDSNYVSYYLNSPNGKMELKRISAGGAQQNLNVASLSKFLVKVPPLKEQQKIAEILSTVDEQIESYGQEREKYTELKKCLMQQLLTGKIRVTV